MILSKIRAYTTMVQFVITVLIVIVLMYLFNKHHRAVRRAWANMQKYLMGFRIVQQGEPSKEATLLMINHQSLLDIVALEAIHPSNICWIAKKEIRKIPLFGHIMVAPKMITVERENKRSLLKLLSDTKDRVENGRVIAIFPEGTRGDGKNLLEFKGGAKLIAQKLNLKVQPIVVCGTKDILDSQKMVANSGTLSVTYLPVIDPKDDKNWYENIQKTMQETLSNELSNNPSHR